MNVSTLSTTKARRKGVNRRLAPMLAVGLTLLAGGGAVNAQLQSGPIIGTEGFQLPLTGDAVLRRLGFTNSLGNPSDGMPIDFATYNYIANPFMAVTQGVAGSYGVPYLELQFAADAITLTHNAAGMLSFGNLGGSLRLANDNLRALNGFGVADSYADSLGFTNIGGGIPAGYGVWPLAGWWEDDGLAVYDYSSYVSVNVDGTQAGGTVAGGETLEIVGGDEEWVILPTFRANAGNGIAGDNVLLSEAEIPNDCVLRQEIRLFRNTAQMTWRVRNDDDTSHQVYIRFAVNNRSAALFRTSGDTANTGAIVSPSYFYTDPDRGPTLRSQVYGINPDGTPARPIPNQVDVLGARYQVDETVADPYHGRFLFNGFGATPPTTVYVADSEDLAPDFGRGFSPGRAGIRYDRIEDGIAVAAYYGPITVAPGATSAPVVVYYGNGNSTDRLDPDFSIGLEAERSLQYNTNAVNTITPTQKANPNIGEIAKQFLLPSRLDVVGSIYNRQLSEAQFNITLPDVRMSLTLPDALRFAISPQTGLQDVASKSLGDIAGDRSGRADWLVEPTGEQFGTFNYVMTTNIGGISPLSRTISRPVTIPATPLYNVSADFFQQIGFPFNFDPTTTNNGDAATILNTLSKPNDTNPGSYVFYEWVPDPDSLDGGGRYAPVSTLERGKGYFYRPALSRLLLLNGAVPDTLATPVASNAETRFYQKVLERGWNMISNPFVYSVPVSFISFADIDNVNPNQDLVQTSFVNAVSSGQVRGGIFFYNPGLNGGAGGYDFFQDLVNQEIRPYQGYWVFLNDRKIVRIAVPTQKQSALIPTDEGTFPVTRKKPIQGAIASGAVFPATQTSNNWKLQFSVKQSGADVPNGRTDSTTFVGVSANAKDGDDTTDLPKPPAIVKDYVSMRVMHEVTKGATRAFAQDLKAPGGKKTWDLEVVSDKSGPVSVSWPNLSRLPKTVRLTLTDKQTGRKHSLKGASSIVVNVAAGAPSRFVLTADKQATRQLAVTNLLFKSEGRGANGSQYSLSFKTTADAQVEARVTTLSGKVVSNMGGGRAAVSGGITRLLWNGRAQDGTSLPAGSYQVEVSARGEDGERVAEIRPILILK
ncbi:MAG: hypothetical protein H7Y38_00345 [Armatimonadetes bacterium]|nr:hypothetical protein [Armatimonadota bacterium]